MPVELRDGPRAVRRRVVVVRDAAVNDAFVTPVTASDGIQLTDVAAPLISTA